MNAIPDGFHGAVAVFRPRHDITVEDRLRYRGSDWLLERRRGELLDFQNPRDRELLSITDEQLSGLIGSAQARIVRGSPAAIDESYAAAVADLSIFPLTEVAEANHRLEYVQEMLRRRLTYRPRTADVQAVIDTVAKRLSDPAPPQVYLVKRWVARALQRSAAGGRLEDSVTAADLLAQHGFKGNRTPRLTFEVRKIVHEEIERVYLTRERQSLDTLVSAIRTRLRRINESRDPQDQHVLPGDKAVMSEILRLGRERVLTARYGSARAYQELGPVEHRADPELPLDVIEIDHTPADLFCVDGLTGVPLGRPTIVVGIDRCTRMPWGIHIGFDPPSVHTVLQCLRNGMFPKTYARMYADAGIWKIVNDWPVYGRPRRLVVDRARENLGRDLAALAPDLPIKVIDAKAGRMGRRKGGVERFLGTLNRTLLQEQKGTTFSNVLQRDDYDAKKNAVITYEELLGKVHAWLIDVYMVRRHGGLRDVPVSVWNRKIQSHRPAQVENPDQIIPLFGRVEHRLLGREGIRFEHLHFTSPELMALLGDTEFRRHVDNDKGRPNVRFRYDTSCLEAIQVYLPHRKTHIRVPVEKVATDYARGLSFWAHKAIVDSLNEEVKKKVDVAGLEAAKARVASALDEEMPESMKIRGRRLIARTRQIGGVAPFADRTATTPAGSFEDNRQITTVEEDEEDVALSAPSAPGRRTTRARPAEPRRPRPASKGRTVTPTTQTPVNDQDDDDIDFYGAGAPRA